MVAPNDGNNMVPIMQQSKAANYLSLFNYLIATTSTHDFDPIITLY